MGKPTEQQGDYQRIAKGELNVKTAEISQFCKQNRIKSKDLFLAYQIALGIPAEEPVKPEISQLATLIDGLSKSGYPLNRVVELVEEMRGSESKLEDYIVKVDELKLSPGERTLVLAIMHKKKVGELHIYTKNGERKILEVPITGTPSKDGEFSERIASRIMEVLVKAKELAGDKGISIVLES